MIVLITVWTTKSQVNLLPPHPGIIRKNVVAGAGSSAGGGRRVKAEARGVVVAEETEVIVVGGVEDIIQALLHQHTVAQAMALLLLQ